VPGEADQVTLVFDVPETLAENCCVLPAVNEALLGLIETATVWAPGFAADEPEEPPQLARPKVTSTQTKTATIQEYRFLLRGPVLCEASLPSRVVIQPRLSGCDIRGAHPSIESARRSRPIDRADQAPLD